MHSKIDFKVPDYLSVIKERMRRLKKIRKDPEYLEACKVHYADGVEGIIDFIEDWMFTFDPRRKGISTVPFILWKRQKEYVRWLWKHYDERRSGLVEKSRDMGVTYLNIVFSIGLWMFHEGTKIGFGSRKQDLVDRLGDPDSIFEKMRLVVEKIPSEFLPAGFSVNEHATFLKLLNPENGNSITGEAGDNIGRGGRNTIYFCDESAFYEHPLKIEAALSQNTDCRFDVSTPNGYGNLFYKKRHAGKIDVFIFDWRQDPRKDMEWYKKQCNELDAVIVAQEVDRDYGASVEGLMIPAKWVQAAINFPISDSGSLEAGLDVADEGRDSNALIIAKGPVVTFIECWQRGNTAQTTKKAVFLCMDNFNCRVLRYDSIGVGAGVKGELSNEGYEQISGVPVATSMSPTPGFYENSSRKNKDMFLNLRAQSWWLLRRRFEKAWEHKNKVREHTADDMISIPNHPQLVSELSQPRYEFTGSGKLKCESKESMTRRGISSPNLADALVLRYSPVRVKVQAAWGSPRVAKGRRFRRRHLGRVA